jgi:CDP-paratose 2-epimerase
VGSTLAAGLKEGWPRWDLIGLDNLIRAGSEMNRGALRRRGIKVVHGDIRNPSDLETLPRCDWILDAAANPGVLAGVDGRTSSRQLLEHNLGGTINLLELARNWRAGFLMLSTSRVYSIRQLAAIPMKPKGDRFQPQPGGARIRGFSRLGVAEDFTTEPPLSLYGSSKRASEILACEYADAFGFPASINRCGVLAGAGQFGKADQGIFSFWIHSWRAGHPLKYVGFNGTGHQVRDCLPDAEAGREKASHRERERRSRTQRVAAAIEHVVRATVRCAGRGPGEGDAAVRRSLAGARCVPRGPCLGLETRDVTGGDLVGNCGAR